MNAHVAATHAIPRGADRDDARATAPPVEVVPTRRRWLRGGVLLAAAGGIALGSLVNVVKAAPRTLASR